MKCKYCKHEINNLEILKHIVENHYDISHSQQEVFDLNEIYKINIGMQKYLTKIEILEIIKNKFIINNRFTPSYSKKYFIESVGIIFYISLFNETIHLTNSPSINERIYCVMHNLFEYPKCQCGESITKFNKTKGINNWHYNHYCSQKCANKYSNFKKTSTFYKKVGKKIAITRRINNSYKLNDAQREKFWTPESRKKREETNLKKYGVKNPGVLGAYSSKSANAYIKNFIKENKFNDKCCYYHGGGINNREFYQTIQINEQNKFISYDLVIFKNFKAAKDKNLLEIELILEYNGPWHYKLNILSETEQNLPATPYPNSKTKLESIEYDNLKLNHIKKFCNNIFIYWEKEKILEKV